jgi:S1-C subfamily serine protease
VTRPGVIAAIAVVSAFVGGTFALVLGDATGWIDGDSSVRTVLVPAPEATAAADTSGGGAARPLIGNGFDPAELYRKRAGGVVTIYALFGEGPIDDPGVTASQGSGFVVSDEGYILTNSHVVTTAGEASPDETPQPADSVYVQFRDGERVPATVVGWDVYDDVGLLKVAPDDHVLNPVPLGDSSTVVVGEPVAAIGSPFGQESSLSVGVVSATKRSIDSLTSGFNLVDAIQTDAPINRGNSGGPMFDASGDVIGINAQIRSESGTAEGVGFAIPINAARRSMEQLIRTGEVRYAWLGVTTQSVTPRIAERFGLPRARGAAVQAVAGGSPAARAGLLGGSGEQEVDGITFCPGGDLIVEIDGTPVRAAEDVVRAVNQQRLPGDRVSLVVLRGSERVELAVTLGDRPASPPSLDCSEG